MIRQRDHSSIIHAKKTLQLIVHLFPLVKSSQTLKLHQQLAFTTYFSTSCIIDSKSLPHMFANFFSNKVLKLHSTIKKQSTNSLHFQARNIPTNLTVFTPFFTEELSKHISQSSNQLCDLDPIPRFLNIVYRYSSPL